MWPANTITSINMAANKTTSLNVIRENNVARQNVARQNIYISMWPEKIFTSSNVCRENMYVIKRSKGLASERNVARKNQNVWLANTYTSPNLAR